MPSCTADFVETSANVGDVIHADFTWADAIKHVSDFVYAAMRIVDPNGTDRVVSFDYDNATGSDSLEFTTDIAGTWTALINVANFASYVECTDTVSVIEPGGPAKGVITDMSANPNPVAYGGSSTVSLTGKNIGDESAYFALNIWRDTYDWIYATLNPGGSFTHTRPFSNITINLPIFGYLWRWNVAAQEWILDDDTDILIQITSPPNGVITNLYANPSTVEYGGSSTVTIEGKNTGDETGDFRFRLVGPSTVTSTSRSIAGGFSSSYSHTFNNLTSDTVVWGYMDYSPDGGTTWENHSAAMITIIVIQPDPPNGAIHSDTVFKFGPFDAGTLVNIIDPLVISNVGEVYGLINWAIYEEGNPTPLIQDAIGLDGETYYDLGAIPLTTPDTAGEWKLCLTVWSTLETEPTCTYLTLDIKKL